MNRWIKTWARTGWMLGGWAWTLGAGAAVQVPDLEFQVTRGPVKYPVVIIRAEAPSKHHFNLKAPWSAKTSGTGISFEKRVVNDRAVEFEVADPSIQENESVDVSLYLCDDANTYCVKKNQSVSLTRAKVVTEAALQAKKPTAVNPTAVKPTESKPVATPTSTPLPTPVPTVASGTGPAASASGFSASPESISLKKDALGFWNDESRAFEEAKKTGKPVLIDFYGIWCPPCNLYNEVVFPSRTFQAQAQAFVLLKVDADRTESWTLKSRYKVGGYPTLVFATPEGEEIDRVVGFFPRDRLVSQMKDALKNRKLSFADRVREDRLRYIRSLERWVEIEFEKKDFQATQKVLAEGLKIDPENVWLRLVDLWIKAKDDVRVLSAKDPASFLQGIESKRGSLRSEELLKHAEIVLQYSDAFSTAQKRAAADSLDELIQKRLNPVTLHLDGEELSVADLRAMKWDLLKSPETLKEIISDYRNLMKAYGGQQSRGFNLELAYYLGQDGQVDQATQIYESFMKKFPKEFTYFFAAARHFQETVKDLDRARTCADRALALSYGDNQIRSVTRLLSIRVAQGQAAEGIEQAKAVLAKVPKFDGLSIRTGRYVSALEKAIEKAQSEIKK